MTPQVRVGLFHALAGSFTASLRLPILAGMAATPHFDKLLKDAEAAAAKQPNKAGVEHVIVEMLRKAKDDPKLRAELERIYPVKPTNP